LRGPISHPAILGVGLVVVKAGSGYPSFEGGVFQHEKWFFFEPTVGLGLLGQKTLQRDEMNQEFLVVFWWVECFLI